MNKKNGKNLSSREKLLLAVLGVMILALCYIKFFLDPVRAKTAEYLSQAESEKVQTASLQSRVTKVVSMRKAIDEAKTEAREPQYVPQYDNSKPVVSELNRILSGSTGYSLSFGVLSRNDYIVERPIQISFTADSYQDARKILTELHDSSFMNMIYDVSFSDSAAVASRSSEDKGCSMELMITYFEADS